ncbi:MAG TPA: STAS domain-containing protein [Stellaceae bacterium]|nr:STAS domain-containing protein [Stellaceae bacterium]
MEINELPANGATVLQLSGRLDGTTSATTDAKLADVVGRNPTLILDLATLDYVSSAGLRVLLKAAKQAQTAKQKLLLAGLQPAVKQVFEISGFSTLFAIFASREDALASLR